MSDKYVVIDHEGYTTYNEKVDAPESFANKARAERRAMDRAREEPGKPVFIYRCIAIVQAEVSDPDIEEV